MPALDPETLVNDNIALAYFFAGKSVHLDHHVALSAALDGLNKAAQSYDPARVAGRFGCLYALRGDARKILGRIEPGRAIAR